MQTIESFGFLVDNIFGELDAASQVVIDCMTENCSDDSGSALGLRIKSVNGHHSAESYLHFLKHLRAEALKNIRETLPGIDPGSLDAFIDLAMRRIRRLSSTVYIPGITRPYEPHARVCHWTARHVTCLCDGKKSRDPQMITKAIDLTKRHAYIFFLILKKLEERINACAGASMSITVGRESHKEKPIYRFRLTCTVPFIAALLRVVCDRNIVESPNISELCRRMANSLSTNRRLYLSPHSLRNHFDNPTPEVLEELLAEIRIWEKYVEKFIQRQRR